MALELTTAALQYLEIVSANPAALASPAIPAPESCFVAAVAEATHFASESDMGPDNRNAVNASMTTMKGLIAAALAVPGSKPATVISVTSTIAAPTPITLPLTISVLDMAWQELTMTTADRQMNVTLIRAAETETAYAVAGKLAPPEYAAAVKAATIATEGVAAAPPSLKPRSTTTRTLSAAQVSGLVSAHAAFTAALKDAGITVPVVVA